MNAPDLRGVHALKNDDNVVWIVGANGYAAKTTDGGGGEGGGREGQVGSPLYHCVQTHVLSRLDVHVVLSPRLLPILSRHRQ